MRPTWREPPGGTRTKQDLSKNQEFQEFLRQCNLTRSQIQQTRLFFLIPPAQRSKARYHNIDILVTWGLKVIQYWKKQDFSRISPEFIIDRETLFILREELDPTCLAKFAKLLGTKVSSFTAFSKLITDEFGRKLWKEKSQIISQAAEVGRRKFLAQLGWLLNYEKPLDIYAKILEIFAVAKKQLNQQGLHPLSQLDWLRLTKEFSDFPWIQSTKQKVSHYARF